MVTCLIVAGVLAALIAPGLLERQAGEGAVGATDAVVTDGVVEQVTTTLTRTPKSPTPETHTPVTEYRILIARHKDESLFVVNLSEVAFPLVRLSFVGKEGISFDAGEWGIEMLESGACVAIWSEDGKSKAPDVTCDLVEDAPHLTRQGKAKFWKDNLEVYFDGERAGSCEKKQEECYVTIKP